MEHIHDTVMAFLIPVFILIATIHDMRNRFRKKATLSTLFARVEVCVHQAITLYKLEAGSYNKRPYVICQIVICEERT